MTYIASGPALGLHGRRLAEQDAQQREKLAWERALQPARKHALEAQARASAANADVAVGTVGSRISAQEAAARAGGANAQVAEGTVGSRISAQEAAARTGEASAQVAEGTVGSKISVAESAAREGKANAGVAEKTAGSRVQQAREDVRGQKVANDQATQKLREYNANAEIRGKERGNKGKALAIQSDQLDDTAKKQARAEWKDDALMRLELVRRAGMGGNQANPAHLKAIFDECPETPENNRVRVMHDQQNGTYQLVVEGLDPETGQPDGDPMVMFGESAQDLMQKLTRFIETMADPSGERATERATQAEIAKERRGHDYDVDLEMAKGAADIAVEKVKQSGKTLKNQKDALDAMTKIAKQFKDIGLSEGLVLNYTGDGGTQDQQTIEFMQQVTEDKTRSDVVRGLAEQYITLASLVGGQRDAAIQGSPGQYDPERAAAAEKYRRLKAQLGAAEAQRIMRIMRETAGQERTSATH